MKLRYITYSILATGLLAVTACKKNNLWVDQDPQQAPEKARFVVYPSIPTAPNAALPYFILDNPAPGSVYKIPVGVTSIADYDRTVHFTYTSRTAVAGQQYTAPAEITIPAGKSMDTLRIQGLFDGYPTGRRDTLKIKIVSSNGSLNNTGYQDSISIQMQKYCNVLLADLQGDFEDTRETNSGGGGAYGPYTSTVTLTQDPASATKATAVFGQFWDYPISVTGTIDWTNPAGFTVTIPRQATGLLYDTDQPIDVRTSPGQISTFSSCDQSYSLTVDFIINNFEGSGSAAYYAQNYKIYIRR